MLDVSKRKKGASTPGLNSAALPGLKSADLISEFLVRSAGLCGIGRNKIQGSA
jgi:hypothetical protein